MESQPQNPEFRNNPENFHPCTINITVVTERFTLNLCMLGNFSCFCCRLLIFFKINFFEKFFQEYHLSVKQIGSRSGPTFCRT